MQSPVPQSPAQTSRRLLQQKYVKRLKARRRMAWLGVWLPAGVAAGMIVLGIAAGIADERGLLPRASLARQIDRAIDWTGLSIQQVSISGLRKTKESDVYAALALEGTRTLLGFDSARAKRRIESLPWVDHVQFKRTFPDGLDVAVIERRPIAVWKLGSRHAAIDGAGRPIATIAADDMPGLPRVVGEGAERGARVLLDRLAEYPDLQRRVQTAERQGNGRWSLHLKQGNAVHLPLENEGEALARAAVLVAAGLAEKGDIDLREGAAPIKLRRSAGRAPASPAVALPAGRT